MLRARPVDAPFALTTRESNTERLYCVNNDAKSLGLSSGMGLSDARALCPPLQTHPADIKADQDFLRVLARWANRYCPWVGLDNTDGLMLDVTGSTHLYGGEEAMVDDMRLRLTHARLQVQIGLAESRGGAWALARYDQGIAPAGNMLERIGALPVAALRLQEKTGIALQRLGVRTIADLVALPRSTLTRRFGPDLLLRLDQALGDQPETVSPLSQAPHYGVRMTLPEPIGLTHDVMAGIERLLVKLCIKLEAQQSGVRVLQLTLRRVDQANLRIELHLARAMRDAPRILPLFERGVDELDAGFGIDQLRLEAVQVEALPMQQLNHTARNKTDGLDDLITRLGNRIGLENIIRFLPADSHIPERSFIIASAAYSKPAGSWPTHHQRPVRLFPPEPIGITKSELPKNFRWRRMSFSTARATGPERIAPEWWLEDDNWHTGLRDYWRVETWQGRRLWLFFTPQNPGWFVQGEFA